MKHGSFALFHVRYELRIGCMPVRQRNSITNSPRHIVLCDEQTEFELVIADNKDNT